MKKIKLYTCENGIALFNKGRTFSAWLEKDESDDVSIMVNERDVIIDKDGGADILKLDSVEIV